MYSVFRTAHFEKEMNKWLSLEEKSQVEKFERKQLPFNPYVGDPLGYRFLREKRLDTKRVYYLIYEEFQSVVLVQISDKKQQQPIIDDIKRNLDNYYQFIKEIKQRGEGDPP